MSSHAMSFYGMLHNIVVCDVMSYHVASSHVISCHVISLVISCHVMSKIINAMFNKDPPVGSLNILGKENYGYCIIDGDPLGIVLQFVYSL